MRFRSCMAAAASVILTTLFVAPAMAQREAAAPICATCRQESHSSIVMSHHGSKNDAQGSMCQACQKFDYKDAGYEGYRRTIPAANRADSYLMGFYANPQYKANIVYGLATYRF